jgi:hypothetical protein
MKLILLAAPILAFTIIGSDRVIDNPQPGNSRWYLIFLNAVDATRRCRALLLASRTNEPGKNGNRFESRLQPALKTIS